MLKYWVWLSAQSKISPLRKVELLSRYGSPEELYYLTEKELSDRAVFTPNERESLLVKDFTYAKAIIDRAAALNIRIITLTDAEYPQSLRAITDPPVVLYAVGKPLPTSDEAHIAVVGTRKSSAYGAKSTQDISYALSKAGFVIVTGLAKGIDSDGAIGALRANGACVGVLGCGVDIVYPKENRALFADVIKNGTIISEYPPGVLPEGQHFPERNRIISGLSLGVAIMEAPEKSGALITAELALEQGRDVFVLPHNIDSKTARGGNLLLRDGAIPLLSAEDITELYIKKAVLKAPESPNYYDGEAQSPASAPKKKAAEKPEPEPELIDITEILASLPENEAAVLRVIAEGGAEGVDFEHIAETTGLAPDVLQKTITMLEIEGAAVSLGFGVYCLAREN
ncbi:MAG: DNA-processing protein DprA [Oscillospiraceae bacterium]|jgi:DNA processing protein|nr:DNA-processing protein DprA [Oscillospiraceae bacterium]